VCGGCAEGLSGAIYSFDGKDVGAKIADISSWHIDVIERDCDVTGDLYPHGSLPYQLRRWEATVSGTCDVHDGLLHLIDSETVCVRFDVDSRAWNKRHCLAGKAVIVGGTWPRRAGMEIAFCMNLRGIGDLEYS